MLYRAGKHTYELVEGWAKLPEGWDFIDVCGLCIDSHDTVYVLNRGDHPVMVFNCDGNLLTSWGEGFFTRAHGVHAGTDGSIYCTDDGNHTVTKFNSESKILLVLGTKDKPSDTGYKRQPRLQDSLATIRRGGSPFNRPTGVALSASGEIYVSDGYGNARVHKFSPDGTLLLSWGEPGNAPGQFRLPHSVWVDKKERVWITDRENSRIQIFDARGGFLSQWTDLSRPSDLFIYDNAVYVSEMDQRVSIFTVHGELIGRWGNQGQVEETALFISPHAIAVDSRGNLYIGEVSMTTSKINRGARTIQKFARKN